MNTSIFTLVLASSLLAAPNETPVWQTSYAQASQQANAQKKPLAIIFGSGGWNKVVRDTAPNADVTKALADSYVCVYIDTATPAGKKFAAGYGIDSGLGIILSDRACSVQAFWHQGDMTNAVLGSALRKYADPMVVVRTTETVSNVRVSLYPPAAAEGPSSPFDSYCPSCNNVRSRRR